MNKRLGALYVALAAITWSGSGVLGKFTTWSPLATAGTRAVIAVLIMAAVRGGFRARLTRGNLLGAFGVASTSIIFVIANKLTTSANAIVLQYAMSVVVILFCWIFYHQRPRARDIATTALVVAGVALCSLDGLSGGRLVGNLLAILTAFTFALVFFCSKMPDADPREYSFLGLIMCTPFALTAFFDSGATLTTGNILAQIGLGACLASGYIFITLGMRTVSPVSAALMSNIEPVLNPLWVFLFLGETPGWVAILGAIVVLSTVTWYSLSEKRVG